MILRTHVEGVVALLGLLLLGLWCLLDGVSLGVERTRPLDHFLLSTVGEPAVVVGVSSEVPDLVLGTVRVHAPLFLGLARAVHLCLG